MRRLFGCMVSLTYKDATADRFVNLLIADSGEYWWDVKQPEARSLWESKIVLGERFFHEVITNPVPLDMNTLRAVKRSPLGIDLYLWLTYRTFHLTRPLRLTWSQLYQQFGAEPVRANDAFTRDGAEVAAMAVAVPRTLRTDGNLHPNGGTWLTVRQCHGRWRRRGGWFSGWRLHARRCRRGAAAPRAAGDRDEHGENSHRSHGGLFLWRVAPGHGPGGVCDDPHCTGSSEREVKRVRVPRMDSEFSDAWLPRREGRPPEPAAG